MILRIESVKCCKVWTNEDTQRNRLGLVANRMCMGYKGFPYNRGLCIGLAIGNGWLPNWISKLTSNQRLIILSSIAGFALLLIGMVQTNSRALMMLLFGVSGLFIGLAVTLITVKISNSVDDAIQGEVMGVQLSLRVLGDGIICLLGGFLLLLSSKLLSCLLHCWQQALLLIMLKKRESN